ncbi:MAG: N-acetyl sugar amidotransferase [Bacteroidia bacterium]|jgi:N-acetyl sugar amidotransferase|nr:N-acetyl sugar amidotransferase [Bacteroidia bacterium]
MRICKRCLYHENHPLHIIINNDGICSGCKVHEEKDEIHWTNKLEELKQLLLGYRNTTGSNYDCIIPVSGAKDSYFIVHTVKNVLGMNPLLVTYNKQYNTAIGIRNLANLRIQFDCDIMTMTVDPNKVKKITRSTFRRFGSVYWHVLAGQSVFPVQIAVKFKIPLIIWGAHQGIDQVGMYSHHDKVEMTRKYRKEHDLMGFEADDLLDDEYDFIREDDIFQYRYPDENEIEQIGVRGIYLNNYIRWDSRTQHEAMIKQYGFETALQNRTFDTYNDTDCWLYNDVHDYLKWLKHGYGKVLDHAVREIRLKQLTKKEGISLVKHYMHKPMQHLDEFLQWLGITENAFHLIADQHRNPAFWKRNESWEWEYQPLLFDAQEELIQTKNFTPFTITPKGVSSDAENQYILFGKGR